MADYLRTLKSKTRSAPAVLAYLTDIGQFIAWLRGTNISISTAKDVERLDVIEYPSHLAQRDLSGVAATVSTIIVSAFGSLTP